MTNRGRKIIDSELNVRTVLTGKLANICQTEFEVEVLNLPIAIREEELKRFFLQFGKITTINQQLLNRKALIGFTSLDG